MRFGAQLPFDKAGDRLAPRSPVVCTVVAPFDVERMSADISEGQKHRRFTSAPSYDVHKKGAVSRLIRVKLYLLRARHCQPVPTSPRSFERKHKDWTAFPISVSLLTSKAMNAGSGLSSAFPKSKARHKERSKLKSSFAGSAVSHRPADAQTCQPISDNRSTSLKS
jgi:hypothetical protein